MTTLKNFKEFRLCQDLFTRFALSFTNASMSNIEMLAKHKKFMTKEPELTNIVYQCALEAAYAKKRFCDRELESLFNNKFKITDVYGNLNKGMSDMSTVNSLFVLDNISRNSTILENKKVWVISTPLEYHTDKYYALQKSSGTKAFVDLSRKTTGNTNAEIKLDHRIYDIKHTTHTATTANHIYPWTYERIEKDIQTHLLSLLENLKRRPFSRINSMLIDDLSLIVTDTSLTASQKNEAWNNNMMGYFDKTPETYTLPIVTQTTSMPFEPKLPKGLHELAQVSPLVLEDKKEAVKAITGITVLLGGSYNKNAHIMTESIIPLVNSINDIHQLD